MELLDKIASADAETAEQVLKAVLARYAQLYPGWEISTFSLEKTGDRNQQIDNMILLLENMKT